MNGKGKRAIVMYRIGEFSKMVDLPVRTLRYYDDYGLLKPSKIDPFTNYRYYSEEDMEEVKKIQQLKELDFTLGEIIEYKDHLDDYILSKKKEELQYRICLLQLKLEQLELLKQKLKEKEKRMNYEKRI